MFPFIFGGTEEKLDIIPEPVIELCRCIGYEEVLDGYNPRLEQILKEKNIGRIEGKGLIYITVRGYYNIRAQCCQLCFFGACLKNVLILRINKELLFIGAAYRRKKYLQLFIGLIF